MFSLSVIIPVYNSEKYVMQCVYSIANQLKKIDSEIILVVDESTDNSEEVCKKLKSEFNDLVVLYIGEKSTVSDARNKGIELSTKDWVMFLDADDYWNDNVISDITDIIDGKQCYDVYVFKWKQYNERTRTYEKPKVNCYKAGLDNSTSLKDRFFRYQNSSYTAVWKLLIKKSILNDHNIWFLPGLKCCEEILFTINLFNVANDIYYSNIELYNYRIGVEGSLTQLSYLQGIRELDSLIIQINELKKKAAMFSAQNYNDALTIYSCFFEYWMAQSVGTSPEADLARTKIYNNYTWIKKHFSYKYARKKAVIYHVLGLVSHDFADYMIKVLFRWKL